MQKAVNDAMVKLVAHENDSAQIQAEIDTHTKTLDDKNEAHKIGLMEHRKHISYMFNVRRYNINFFAQNSVQS